MRDMLGIEIGPEVYEIEKGMIKKYSMAIEASNPLWFDEVYAKTTEYKGIIAPPTFLMDCCHLIEQTDWLMSLNGSLSRLLNGGMEIENYQVVKAGDIISVTGKLVDLYERESKKLGIFVMVVLERSYKNQRDEIVAKGRFNFIKY